MLLLNQTPKKKHDIIVLKTLFRVKSFSQGCSEAAVPAPFEM